LATTEGVSWQRQKALIGVDYGQVGVFDTKYFRRDEVVPKEYRWKKKPLEPENPWYSLCCDQTLDSVEAGVIPFGAVSSSGFGDGVYEWDLLRDRNGEAVAIRVVFVDE
jgi:hypothetical protein